MNSEINPAMNPTLNSEINPETLLELMHQRHCKRAFLPDPVPRDVLARILTAAAQAPSSKNTQPWGVAVIQGPALQAFSQHLCALFDAQTPQVPDYAYFPDPWPAGFLERARACGYGLFELKGIDRRDRPARRAHDRENFTFFGAPACLIFHLPAQAERGSFLDLGFLMQNLMLGLVAFGLASCPQFSVAGYPDAIRDFLGLEERLIVCGMAIGYPDPAAEVNTYVPERLPLEAFVQWFEAAGSEGLVP